MTDPVELDDPDDPRLADYRDLLPPAFARGIKLFFDEDTRLFTPAEVMGLAPPPDVVTYQ